MVSLVTSSTPSSMPEMLPTVEEEEEPSEDQNTTATSGEMELQSLFISSSLQSPETPSSPAPAPDNKAVLVDEVKKSGGLQFDQYQNEVSMLEIGFKAQQGEEVTSSSSSFDKDKESGTLSSSSKPKVPCKYANCGCQELVQRGTWLEKDHYQSCDYRPVPCLMAPFTCQPIPYYDFILHHIHHKLIPAYSSSLTTQIIIKKSDFSHDQHWTPKWLSAYGVHFFFNLVRRAEDGIWAAWVYMFGHGQLYPPGLFLARITFHKRGREFGGIYPVHSIRVSLDEMMEEQCHGHGHGSCLLMTSDETMKDVCGIEDLMLTDISVNVEIVRNTGQLALLEESAAATTTTTTTTHHHQQPTTISTHDIHEATGKDSRMYLLEPQPSELLSVSSTSSIESGESGSSGGRGVAVAESASSRQLLLQLSKVSLAAVLAEAEMKFNGDNDEDEDEDDNDTTILLPVPMATAAAESDTALALTLEEPSIKKSQQNVAQNDEHELKKKSHSHLLLEALDTLEDLDDEFSFIPK